MLAADEMRELMAMLGGVPRACVEHMARFMCHPHWARQVVATLADGDASPNQLRDHVNVLQNKVRAAALEGTAASPQSPSTATILDSHNICNIALGCSLNMHPALGRQQHGSYRST